MRPGGIEFTVTPWRPTSRYRPFAQARMDALGLGLAGDVDDAAPLARHHLREQPVRELAVAREVERHRLVPLRLARLQREAPAAAGVVDQDVDRAERAERGLGDLRRGVLV